MNPETKPTHTPTQIGHSPLPWRMMPFGEKNLPFIAAGKSGYAVADTVMVSVNEDEARANAAFIVRAVNAHEQLVALAKEFATEIATSGCGCTDDNYCEDHQRIADIIAKAEQK